MKIELDCIHCILRQGIEAARLASADVNAHHEITVQALDLLGSYQEYSTPPQLAKAIHLLVQERTGNQDPYKQIKKRDIETAHKLCPGFADFVRKQPDRLQAALAVAAVGNLLDAGVYGNMETVDIEALLMEEVKKGLGINKGRQFLEELKTAAKILIIGDNAGETVFDRLLISEMKKLAPKDAVVYYGVRSIPILNDATREDAIASGLDQVATIIETGSTLPGTVLGEASRDFAQLFRQADLVLSKGQGNYETLDDTGLRPIYFLLKVKCQLVAAKVKADLGEYALLRK